MVLKCIHDWRIYLYMYSKCCVMKKYIKVVKISNNNEVCKFVHKQQSFSNNNNIEEVVFEIFLCMIEVFFVFTSMDKWTTTHYFVKYISENMFYRVRISQYIYIEFRDSLSFLLYLILIMMCIKRFLYFLKNICIR